MDFVVSIIPLDSPRKTATFIRSSIMNFNYSMPLQHLVRQLMGEIRKGFKVMRIERIGDDKNTTYNVQGLQ